MAFVGKLTIVRLPRARIDQALASVAEVALALGTTASLPKTPQNAMYPGGAAAGPFDTVWLDVSGCARLVGGEDLLCAELSERVSALGHINRVAIASGPRIAQAVARWVPSPVDSGRASGSDQLVVPHEESKTVMASLPIAALPIDSDLLAWLGKLGLFHIEDIARIDRRRLAHRLGRGAKHLIELIEGRDDVPLDAYQPPRQVIESAHFEDELDTTEPLRFVLKGLVARTAARLSARGEACTAIRLELTYERAAARLHNLNEKQKLDPTTTIGVDLPVPLHREEDLFRTMSAKLDSFELAAPITSVELRASNLTSAPQRQLATTSHGDLDTSTLPTLLAELSAWLGSERLGTLCIGDSHRPEARSVLAPITNTARRLAGSQQWPGSRGWMNEPTRILAPVPVSKLQVGSLIATSNWSVGDVPGSMFVIDHLRLCSRIEHVEWWSDSPVNRDYARVWLHTMTLPSAQTRSTAPRIEHSEAWLYRDRTTRQTYLHGWYE